jgi:hypothetical protein
LPATTANVSPCAIIAGRKNEQNIGAGNKPLVQHASAISPLTFGILGLTAVIGLLGMIVRSRGHNAPSQVGEQTFVEEELDSVVQAPLLEELEP